ncbi:MAG: VOC family protein [Chloroflexota bacterium]
MIKGIKSINIDVSDLSQALDLFIERLDLPLLREIGSRDIVNRWEMGFGRPATTLAVEQKRDPARPTRPGRVTVFFETDDLESDYRVLQEKGIIFNGPPALDPFDGKVAYFDGPDGVTLGLVEPYRDQ